MSNRAKFNETDFFHDLGGANSESGGLGGEIRVANIASFPALEDQGISYTLFTIEPCCINLPHVHPRVI